MKTLVAAVMLGGVFGSATATVVSIDEDVMVVDIEVEVSGSAQSVVAHLSFEDEEVGTLPLLDRGEGTYGLRTELEPRNYVVVFEILGEGAESSAPVSFLEMGADLRQVPGAIATTAPDEGPDEGSQRMLWLAIALGAASLSLLAFWVLGGRDDERDIDEEERGHASSVSEEREVVAEEE